MKKFKIWLVICLAFFLLLPQIGKPFVGHHDWNGVFYSNIARNYLRYGFLKTKFGEVTNYGVVKPNEFHYHTNHPVLFPILLAIFLKFFGIHEWSARLFAIIFSLISLYVFNLILRDIYRLKNSYLYLLLGILTPLFLYYARMPVYEPVITLFILLTIYFYFLWRRTSKRNHFILIAVSLFMSQMIEWPGFYLSFILFFHHLIFPVKKNKRFLGVIWLMVAFLSFLIIVFHQFVLTGQIQGNLAKIFLFRLTGGGGGNPFSLEDFVRLELARARSFLTSTLLLLTFLWVLDYGRRIWQKEKITASSHFVVFYLFFGLIHIIIFPNVAWYHDYMLYYFLPPVWLTASLGLAKIQKWQKKRRFLIFSLVLFLIFIEKRQFLKDLMNLRPHAECVLWGKQIKKGKRLAVIESDNLEQIKICPPFTNFYADQIVQFKLIDHE